MPETSLLASETDTLRTYARKTAASLPPMTDAEIRQAAGRRYRALTRRHAR
jgi:hypothetical protein